MQSKTFRRKIDAREFQAKVDLGQAEQPPKDQLASPGMVFSEFIDVWLKDHGAVYKTESSLIRDRQVIRDVGWRALFKKYVETCSLS